jgi:hypothetical protein
MYPGPHFGHVCSSFGFVLREIFFCYTFYMGNALDPRRPIQRTLAVAGRLRDLEKFKHNPSPVSGLGKHGPAEPKK